MPRTLARPLTIFAAGLALLFPAAGIQAADANVYDPKAIERWSDEVFGKALAEHRFSGLGIAVTQNDKVLFTKGYGYQDWATKTAVSPEKTQFRIASLTKTFVAAGIMQLHERGKIASLDDPANKYLKRFQFKQNGGQDITLWDLLTHRAGFGTPNPVNVDPETVKMPVAAEILSA